MAEIREKAVSATTWSGAETVTRVGLQFAVTVALARLLTPEDYGTVALLAVFIGFAGVFINSGFPSALVQRQDVSETDLSSVWLFNVIMATVTAGLLCLASGWIAAFYDRPVLRPLTWLLSADLIVSSLTAVHRVQLVKALDFHRLFWISFAALGISGVVAIYLAWRGYGVWTLGWQTLVYSGVASALLCFSSRWHPRFAFSLESVRSLFRFGSFLLMSAILDVLYTRLNTLVIGKFYSPTELGHYSRADNTAQMPGSLLASILNAVAFPVFSRLQHDQTQLQNGLRKAVRLTMLVNIPLMLGMLVTAKPLVLLLFGQQWLPCVPYLQILCVAGLLLPLHVLNLSILIAQGHADRFFRLEVAKKTVSLVLLGVACPFGVTAIAGSAVAASAVCFLINAYYSEQLLAFGARAQVVDLLPYAGAGVLMAGCVAAIGWALPAGPLLQLTGQVLAGAAVYAALCAAFRLPAFLEAWRLLKTSPLTRLTGARAS